MFMPRSIERCCRVYRVNGYGRLRSSSLTLLRKFLKEKRKKVSISLAIHALIDTKSPNAIQSWTMSRCIDLNVYLVMIRHNSFSLSLSLTHTLSVLLPVFLTGIRRGYPCCDLSFDDNGSFEPFNKRDHCLISAWFLVIWRPNSLVAVPTPEREPSARNWSPVPSINQAR